MSSSPEPHAEAAPLSPAQLAAILGNVADGVVVTDAAGRVRFVNDSAARIARFEGDAAFRTAPFETLITRYEFFDPSGASVALDDLPTRRALRGEGTPETVLHLRERETGREEWWAVRVTVLRTADGALDAVVALFRDITERQHVRDRERLLSTASALLADSLDYEATLQRVADFAVREIADWCAVDLLAADGALATVAIAHIDPEKVALAREYQRRYPPDPQRERGTMSVLRTGEPLLIPEVTEEMIVAAAADSEHLRMLRALGMRSVLVLPLLARGRALGRLTFIASGERRRYGAEELPFAQELAHRAAVAIDNARLYREAREAEGRYRGLFEGTADAVLVTDEEGRYLDANPAMTALIGYTLNELRGMRVGDLSADPEWAAEHRAGVLREGMWRGEMELVRKDGTVVPVEGAITALSLPSGTVSIATWRDISERRRAEEEQHRLVAMVAHELRNPLTTIVGYAALMQRRERYDAKGTAIILDQTRRLERLTLDLRAALRLQAGMLSLHRAAVDPSALITGVVEQARTATDRPILAIIAGNVPTAYWDADRVAQVLGNLIQNAIIYSPDGGAVHVETVGLAGAVRITVTDAGVGIPPEALARIFEPFYRAGNAAQGRSRGMGLGLPIARALVEAHGGTIVVASVLGAGTTFTVTLPYGEPPDTDLLNAPAPM